MIDAIIAARQRCISAGFEPERIKLGPDAMQFLRKHYFCYFAKPMTMEEMSSMKPSEFMGMKIEEQTEGGFEILSSDSISQ